MEGKRFKSLEEFSDALVSVIPGRELRKFEKNVFGRRLPLKRQFIAWCKIYWKVPRYSEETTKEVFSDILERKNSKRWKEFRFSVLKDITQDLFDLVYGEESKKHEKW